VPVERVAPSEEAAELFALTRELAAKEVAPHADAMEAAGEFPRQVFATLGAAGLLGLPYDEQFGGGGQPYEVFLQVVEELAVAPHAHRGDLLGGGAAPAAPGSIGVHSEGAADYLCGAQLHEPAELSAEQPTLRGSRAERLARLQDRGTVRPDAQGDGRNTEGALRRFEDRAHLGGDFVLPKRAEAGHRGHPTRG